MCLPTNIPLCLTSLFSQFPYIIHIHVYNKLKYKSFFFFTCLQFHTITFSVANPARSPSTDRQSCKFGHCSKSKNSAQYCIWAFRWVEDFVLSQNFHNADPEQALLSVFQCLQLGRLSMTSKKQHYKIQRDIKFNNND